MESFRHLGFFKLSTNVDLCVCIELALLTCVSLSQGYTLAEEEEDPLIFQHRQLRGNQSDTLVSGPVESGPMKKLHVSTTALQKVCRMTCSLQNFTLTYWSVFG